MTEGDARAIDRLLAIMARLRDPQSGCPWDVQQTFATIAPYTIEDTGDMLPMDVNTRHAASWTKDDPRP